jgi:hypothetical protein
MRLDVLLRIQSLLSDLKNRNFRADVIRESRRLENTTGQCFPAGPVAA